jgi:hypothetical protein
MPQFSGSANAAIIVAAARTGSLHKHAQEWADSQ